MENDNTKNHTKQTLKLTDWSETTNRLKCIKEIVEKFEKSKEYERILENFKESLEYVETFEKWASEEYPEEYEND